VLKLMYAALIRATETWRGIGVTVFPLPQFPVRLRIFARSNYTRRGKMERRGRCQCRLPSGSNVDNVR
jgi:hypothetical protein